MQVQVNNIITTVTEGHIVSVLYDEYRAFTASPGKVSKNVNCPKV
jgi:hypothetical protein